MLGNAGEELSGALLLGIGNDILGVALLHDDTAVHKDHAVSYIPGKAHFVSDNDHGHMFLGKLANDLENLTGQFRIQCGGGLVKEKDLRLHSQGTGDGHTLLLSAGELAGIGTSLVGKAHLLGFGSFDGVKKAKGALYDYVAAHDGEVFVNADDADLVSMAESRSGMVLIPYGIENDEVEILPVTPEEPFLRLGFADGRVLKTSLVGSYNAANVLAALCIGRHFGVDEDAAFAAISSYTPSNSRSQMVRTADNTLIVDAYNANPSSMRAALDNFSRIEASHKTALLGDMRELGENSVNEHIDILRLALSLGLSDLCLVGDEFSKAMKSVDCPPTVRWYPDSAELASALHDAPLAGHVILIKGSRGIMMEKVLGEV